MRPLVLHLDIDAFFASVEQLRNPRLAGRPVAVGSGVIASCSYEAREHGLQAGMPLGKALRQCPPLVIVRGHESIYRCYAARLFEICHNWSPVVEEHLDEAYCDLAGTERIYPDPRQEVARLRDEIHSSTGLTVTAGLGRNRMFARLIGKLHKPDGLGYIEPEQEESLLLQLPIESIPGVGPRTATVLSNLGIEKVEQLRELSRSALSGLLGRNGEILYERCRGEDHRLIGGREIPRSIQRGTSFDEDISCPRTLDAMIEYLAERIASNLRQRGLEAGGLALQLVHGDHRRDRRRVALAPPTALDPPIIKTALELRRAMEGRRTAIRFVGIHLDRIRLAATVEQGDLFTATTEDPADTDLQQQQRWKRLLGQVDRIRMRHGHGALLRGSALALQDGRDRGGTALERDRHGLILRTSCLTR
ncbi:MAG: hypothetical protein DSY81_01945 [Bacillota bacterium]|nr:MAG: hypothetical protein DSY81_01945 [Bacillota bacterium]